MLDPLRRGVVALLGVASLAFVAAGGARLVTGTDGQLDTTLDGDGRVLYDNPGTAGDTGTGVGASNAGRTVFAAQLTTGTLVGALGPTGALDPTFAAPNGFVTLPTGYRPADVVVIDAGAGQIGDGKVIVAGSVGLPGQDDDVFIARYKTDGTGDEFFSDDGFATFVPSASNDDDVRAVAFASNGNTVVAGLSGGAPFVMQAGGEGAPSASCDGDGYRLGIDFPGSNDQVYAVAVDGGGGAATTRIAIAGSVNSGNGSDTSDLAVALLNAASCGPIATFGSGGVVVDNLFLLEQARGVAIERNGKVVVAGTARATGAGPPPADMFVARYEPDGDPDTTCAGSGKVLIDFGGDDVAGSLTVQPDGKYVVAGSSGSDVAIARLMPKDCRFDKTFDGDGRQTYPFSGTERVNAVAISPSDGKIVLAGDRTSGGNTAVLVSRVLGGSGIFADDFETNDVEPWSDAVP